MSFTYLTERIKNNIAVNKDETSKMCITGAYTFCVNTFIKANAIDRKLKNIPVEIIWYIVLVVPIRSKSTTTLSRPNPKTRDKEVNKNPAKIELTVIMSK